MVLSCQPGDKSLTGAQAAKHTPIKPPSLHVVVVRDLLAKLQFCERRRGNKSLPPVLEDWRRIMGRESQEEASPPGNESDKHARENRRL